MNVPDAKDLGQSCVRAFPDSMRVQWKPLLTVASEAGFWNLSNDEVLRFATAAGVAGVSESTSLCDNISKFAQSVLGKRLEGAMERCKKRLGRMAPTSGVADALVEADACIGMMTEEDREDAMKQKQKHEHKERDYHVFMDDYIEQTRVVYGQPKKKARKWQPQYPSWPDDGITQPVAKSMTLPGGFICRGIGYGYWACHYEPWPRKSFAWSLYGHEMACKLCLRHLWKLHLRETDQALAQCPIKGLFD